MSNRVSPEDPPAARTVVVGAGAWGTTLANLIASTGRDCTLVANTEAHAAQIASVRMNERYLPAIRVNERVCVTHDLEHAVPGAEVIVIVVPSQQMRAAAMGIVQHARHDALLVSCAKGIELGSLLRMSEVIVDATGVSPERVCALSGPNLAREIAEGLPASAVVASSSEPAARIAQHALAAASFRLYTSSDVIGVELGGALKNVIALGAGVAGGLGLGLQIRDGGRGDADGDRVGRPRRDVVLVELDLADPGRRNDAHDATPV